MTCKKSGVLALVSVGFLAACNGSDGGGGTIESSLNLVNKSALTAGYVTSFAPFEAAAAALRTSNPRYTVQKHTWREYSTGKIRQSNSLDSANVEYAHAVGLTGAGQTIAVVDGGFLTSHVEFAGKNITVPVAGLPAARDHGTAVAAIAAGSATSGQTVGVAPGADLLLGGYQDFTTSRLATEQATSMGAIVQNNSWGLLIRPGVEATANYADFSYYGQFAEVRSYVGALQDYARNGVIVFAASNDKSRTVSDLTSALPNFVSGLQSSWITVVNATPRTKGNNVVGASLISSACLQAAAYCMAADGAVVVAQASSNNAYETQGYGSSYAAPQVAGAIALLAEAFPTLTAKELRARLLASANNRFYKHTGYVKFADGIKHGYNSTYGHGFLDVRRALLPIGQSFVPLSSGRNVRAGSPVVLSGGMSGNAISKRLSRHNLMFVDGMGGGFEASANMLTAELEKKQDIRQTIGDLMSVNLNSDDVDLFQSESRFSSLVAGKEMEVQLDNTRVAMLLPIDESREGSFGFEVAQTFDLGRSALSVGFRTMREGGSFVGMRATVDGDSLAANHNAATLEWALPLSGKQQVKVSGAVGVAVPYGNVSSVSLSQVEYNSVKVSYGTRDVLGRGDRLSLGVNLPQVVHAGSAEFSIPVSMSRSGAMNFSNVDVGLSPDARQVDLSIGYGVPLSDRSEMVMSAVHSLNSGNISGRTDSVAAVGWRLNF
ncbi:MAG: S8 family peptidase [Marinosulfonomonas sp.]